MLGAGGGGIIPGRIKDSEKTPRQGEMYLPGTTEKTKSGERS